MARQLIFTSAPQGLEPGRSGYCTVARHKDIRSRLVRELERLSVYDYNQQGEGPKAKVALFRKLALGSEEFFVISRISDAGLDYTNRTNYIAHHLILDSFEIATVPSPAEILSNWNGWKSKWEEGPRYLEDSEEVDLTPFKSPALIPANGWLAATNDPGNAAILVSPSMKKPVLLEVHPGQEESLLKLFAESSALHKLSLDAWDYSFTTFLQENDDAKMFSWIGARGQPVAERMKQGGTPNYLDLRDFAQSKVVDPIDDDLAHVARKGPKAKAAGAKSPKTRAKAPKAFSDREMAQFQQAASSYTASTTPAGSTVSAQDGSSAGKKRKKRPWLMQLAVISTALCLLVGLVVGLAYNLGDFLNKNGDEPDPDNPPIVSPVPDVTPDPPDDKPVVKGATLMVGKPGVVVLREKDEFLDWVKFDVGSPDPITVDLNRQQRKNYRDFLGTLSPDDKLQVTLVHSDAGLFIETLGEVPVVQAMGEPFEESVSGENAVSLSPDGSSVTFNLPSRGELTYDLPLDRTELREQIKELVEALRENPSIEAPLKLRIRDNEIVGIDSIAIPESGVAPKTPVNPEIIGTPKRIALKDSTHFRFLEGENRIQIKVDDINSLYYQIPQNLSPENKQKIVQLEKLLNAGRSDLKLNFKIDENAKSIIDIDFASLSFPELVPVNVPSGPSTLVPSSAFIVWLPYKKKVPGWPLDLPETGKDIQYFDKKLSTDLFDVMMALKDDGAPRLWMVPFTGPDSFYNPSPESDAFEPLTFEYEEDVDPTSRGGFLLKTVEVGQSRFFIHLSLTKGESANISFEGDIAENRAREKGFVLRIPLVEQKSCIDIYFVSKKHFSPQFGQLPRVKRGEQLILTQSTFSFQPSWPFGNSFHIATREKQQPFSMRLVPAENETAMKFYPNKTPSANDFSRSPVPLLKWPEAFVSQSPAGLFASEIKVRFDYYNEWGNSLLQWKAHYQGELAKNSQYPDSGVFSNLRDFGSEPKVGLKSFEVGSIAYEKHLITLVKDLSIQALDLDAVKANVLQSQLILLTDVLNQRLLERFWIAAEKYIKDNYLNRKSFRGFQYSSEQAQKDIVDAFLIIHFFLHAEKAFGVNDTNLQALFQKINESFAARENPESLLAKLEKQIMSIPVSDSGSSTALKLFNESYSDYLDAYKEAKTPTNLVWTEYVKSIGYLRDVAKYEIFTKNGLGKSTTLKKYIEFYSQKINLLANSRGTVDSNVQQTRKALSKKKWALALFRKVPAPVVGQTPTSSWEHLADLVTFSSE